MPRPPRTDIANITYHVINRSNWRTSIFNSAGDYQAFERVLIEAKERVPIQIFAYSVMPNHWHMVLQPKNDGDLSRFIGWLTMTHTQRWHVDNDNVGSGHLYQGRYKSFPVQSDQYFLAVCRYVERNPLRARLVTRAQDWRWGSLWRREFGDEAQKKLLDEWLIEKPNEYLDLVNQGESEEHLSQLRTCLNRGQPYGSNDWTAEVAHRWGLESTLHKRGRPKNKNCS